MLALAALAGTYSLVVGGDLMLNGIPPGSGPLRGVASAFRAADFALANLETPLTSAKTATSRKSAQELKEKSQFVLKADPRHLASLKNAGIDLVSLANNHAMDYGARGLIQTRALLSRSKIVAAGAGANGPAAAKVAIVEGRDGFRLGLLSALAFVGRGALRKCSPAGAAPGVNVLAFDGKIDEKAMAKLERWVGAARGRCDYLVVALHWGIERQPRPTSYQKALGRAVIDAGADLVWGHHPHVLQPTETYRGRPILYSTGNLVSPLPGKTALFRLAIGRHRTASIMKLPVTIANGKAFFEPSPAQSVKAGRILNKPRTFRP